MSRGGVFHVTNQPTPYRTSQFLAFSHALTGDGIDLVIYFIGCGRRRRSWHIAPGEMAELNTIDGGCPSPILRAWRIARTIHRLKPGVVVLAWAMNVTALLVLLYGRASGIPCLVYTGETLHTAPRRRLALLRSLVRALFFKLADGWITYGSESRDYVLAHGVASDRVSVAINVVDTRFFVERVDAERSAMGAGARSRFRLADGSEFACHLLCVGELLRLKRIPLLLAALHLAARPDVALHIVGSGPEERFLRERVEDLGLGSQVFFHGYAQKTELPPFYAMADVFVFPSDGDVFGLVLVEAAAAGLPIIASRFSGGTRDVVVDGISGFAIDPNDTAGFADVIVRLADDADLRRSFGAASRRHALDCLTLERSAVGYREAISRAIQW